MTTPNLNDLFQSAELLGRLGTRGIEKALIRAHQNEEESPSRPIEKAHVKGHIRTLEDGRTVWIENYETKRPGRASKLHERTALGLHKDGSHYLRATDADDATTIEHHAKRLGIKVDKRNRDAEHLGKTGKFLHFHMNQEDAVKLHHSLQEAPDAPEEVQAGLFDAPNEKGVDSGENKPKVIPSETGLEDGNTPSVIPATSAAGATEHPMANDLLAYAPTIKPPTKIYLDVPFADKDRAKSAGAKWDGDARKWYWPKPDGLPQALAGYAPKDVPNDAKSSQEAINAIFDALPGIIKTVKATAKERATTTPPGDKQFSDQDRSNLITAILNIPDSDIAAAIGSRMGAEIEAQATITGKREAIKKMDPEQAVGQFLYQELMIRANALLEEKKINAANNAKTAMADATKDASAIKLIQEDVRDPHGQHADLFEHGGHMFHVQIKNGMRGLQAEVVGVDGVGFHEKLGHYWRSDEGKALGQAILDQFFSEKTEKS